MTWHQILYFALLTGSSGYAFVRGGGPERWMATSFLFTVALSIVLLPSTPVSRGVVAAVLWPDLLLFLLIIVLTLRADRRWPVAMAAMQGLTLLGHLVPLLRPDVDFLVYAVLVVFWSFPMLLLLIVAVWRHDRRVLQGAELDWAPRPPIRAVPRS